MVKTSKVFISLIFLFASLPNISKEEENDWLNERNKNIYCQRPSCNFNITYYNPYSPMILGNEVKHAKYESYYYIYILFPINSSLKRKFQQIFYLEVYDFKTGENFLSNGDCHLINLTARQEYELQILKPIYNDTILILRFLGLNRNFSLNTTIYYVFSFSRIVMSLKLNSQNTLNKSDINELKEYEKEFNQQLIELNDRKTQAIITANKIIYNLIGKQLKANLEYKFNILQGTFGIWPFISVTVTVACGMEAYSEHILGPAEDEVFLSNFFSINGVIESGSDCFETIDDKIKSNNILLNIVKIFNKKINDFLYTIALDTEVFSLTIAASPINRYASLTFRFFDLKTRKIFFEIQFKYELTFKPAFELALANNYIFAEALDKAAEFSEKHSKDFGRIIFAMILVIIVVTLVILALPLVAVNISLAKIFAIFAFKVPLFEANHFIHY